MGQTLSEPITAKESSSLQNKSVKVGSSSMQGWRITMEDAHTHILTMADDKEASFFAVYDGHGGSKVSAYVSRHLHKLILRRPEYKERRYEEAIIKGFLECDDKMRHDESMKEEMSGSTAVAALLRGYDLYVGNVGDSRCIASIGGVADPLTTDHKPADPLEKERIVSAGGFVELNRVNGNLALSRAVGDFAFKQNANIDAEDQIVSGCPEVTSRSVNESWEFILIACDGIWDVLSNQQVTDFVIRRIANGLEPEVICEELMTRCLATDNNMCGLGCDNMTVILVCFLHNQPYERLVERCKEFMRKRDEAWRCVDGEGSSSDQEEGVQRQEKMPLSKAKSECGGIYASDGDREHDEASANGEGPGDSKRTSKEEEEEEENGSSCEGGRNADLRT